MEVSQIDPSMQSVTASLPAFATEVTQDTS